ncbi:MAG: SHOCT domain-containing protein [Bacillota bacterium]|nr:SHOCT domain-containing protein [Bacillota bacterium]
MRRYGYGMMPWGGLLCFLVVALLVVAVVIYKVIKEGRNNNRSASNGNALEILKERYARGEIDEEQYTRMRDRIEK